MLSKLLAIAAAILTLAVHAEPLFTDGELKVRLLD
jgi:hypothetical protein